MPYTIHDLKNHISFKVNSSLLYLAYLSTTSSTVQFSLLIQISNLCGCTYTPRAFLDRSCTHPPVLHSISFYLPWRVSMSPSFAKYLSTGYGSQYWWLFFSHQKCHSIVLVLERLGYDSSCSPSCDHSFPRSPSPWVFYHFLFILLLGFVSGF